MACGNLATETASFGQAGRLGVSFGNCWRLILLIMSKIRLLGVDLGTLGDALMRANQGLMDSND
jgi:hypothetical protein